MKYLIIILLISSIGYSQNLQNTTQTEKVCKFKQITTFEKILYTELAVIGYGVADYILYNSFKNKSVENYRFIQGCMFSAINYLLYKLVSPQSSIAFSIQTIGGVPDAVYYSIDKGFSGFNGFSYGNEFNMNKDLNHLNFIPSAFMSKHVKGVDLITSMILTTAISITIQL